MYVPPMADWAEAPLYSTVKDHVLPDGIGVELSSAVCSVPVPLVVNDPPLNWFVDMDKVLVVGMVNTPPTAIEPVAFAL